MTSRLVRRIVGAATLGLALVLAAGPVAAQTAPAPSSTSPQVLLARRTSGTAGLVVVYQQTDPISGRTVERREFFTVSELADSEWGAFLWSMVDPEDRTPVIIPSTPSTSLQRAAVPTTASTAPRPAPAARPVTDSGPGRVGPTNPAALQARGPLRITQPGAVITDVDVAGEITVAASNVTIRNFRANNVQQLPGYTGLLLEDGEIHGEQNPLADGVSWSGYTARRLDVHDVNDAFKAHGNVVIEDSWIHDLTFRVFGADEWTHNDGVQISTGSNIVIRGNRFERNRGNAAVFIDSDFGPIRDVLVEGNYLGGGGYTLYSIPSPKAPGNGVPQQITVRNNLFSEEHLFGYAVISGGTTFTGNTSTSGLTVTASRG